MILSKDQAFSLFCSSSLCKSGFSRETEPIGCAHTEICDKEACSHEANKPQICRDDVPVQAQRPEATLDPVRANVSDQIPSRRIPSYLGSVFCHIQAFN